MSVGVAEIETSDNASQGLWALAWRRLRRDRIAMLSLFVIGLFTLMALASFAGILASKWNDEVAPSYSPPSLRPVVITSDSNAVIGVPRPQAGPPADISDIDPLAPRYQEWRERAAQLNAVETRRAVRVLLGADKWGRDVLSKVIKGSQISISVGVLAALLAVIIGTSFGAVAGYFGGVVDDVLEWFYNVFTSIPYVLLVLAVAAVFSHGLTTIVLILGLTSWTGVYRLVRAEYFKHAERAYVRAAQALGASHVSRMFEHILPNISHVILVQYSRYVVDAIKAEVILSFLGLGVPVSSVSWGTILAETTDELVIGKWWQMLAAGGSMAILVTAISLLTDSMRDALDPKLSE